MVVSKLPKIMGPREVSVPSVGGEKTPSKVCTTYMDPGWYLREKFFFGQKSENFAKSRNGPLWGQAWVREVASQAVKMVDYLAGQAQLGLVRKGGQPSRKNGRLPGGFICQPPLSPLEPREKSPKYPGGPLPGRPNWEGARLPGRENGRLPGTAGIVLAG